MCGVLLTDCHELCATHFFFLFTFRSFSPLLKKLLSLLKTAVKPAAVQKNTVKPAAIEIKVRVYYNDYGNHRNNTEETRF